MLHLVVNHIVQLTRLFKCALPCVFIMASVAQADVRILLDISRSMAENDPARVRTEALDMLVASIPDGEKAAIWTFGQYVNLLMPHQTVNDAWRRQATERLNAQTYPAVRTNIGRALEEAAYDFDYSSFQGDIDLILVTDGKADIAPNDDVNRVERERILTQLVPRFAAANARIHTLALSEKADLSLLRQLSEQTGGYYQLVQQPGQLTAALMTLSDEVTPMTQLAMDAQSFQVDDSIRELTVLMYHTQGAVSLTSPSGSQTSAVQPGNQRWRVGNGFSQVSISSPERGIWKVNGKLQSGSAIRVISDINVQWQQPAQSVLAQGSVLDIQAQVVDDRGNNVTGRLNTLIQASIRVDGQPVPTQVDADGIRARYLPLSSTAETSIELMVDGGTFNRMLTRQIRYVHPYLSEVLVTKDGYQWRLYPNRFLNGEDSRFAAFVSYPTQTGDQQQSFVQTEAGYWLFTFPSDMPDGDYELTLNGYMETDTAMTQLPSETVRISLPIVANTSYAMTPDVMAAMPSQTDMPLSASESPAYVKDSMPEFAELKADIVVSEPSAETEQWQEQPNVTAVREGEPSNWLSYVLVSVPGILVLAGVYFVYRRLEQRAKGPTEDKDVILGGEEFASLDNIDELAPDKDLDISSLDEGSDDPDALLLDEPLAPLAEADAVREAEANVPVVDDAVDDIPANVMEEDIPAPTQTEAPTLAEEDMLDEPNQLDGDMSIDEFDSDADEELFDISSIDDDLADLDLALDGDDPFADAEDDRTDR